VYHTYYKPLEWTVAEREDNTCYLKVICNKADDERVVGYHVRLEQWILKTHIYTVLIIRFA